VSDAVFEVRRLEAADLARFQDGMPSWNSREYATRLRYQDRGLAVQLVVWIGDVAAGRGMLVLPGHPEWSASALREGCPEIRDLAVGEDRQRRGIGTALIRGLEHEASEAGHDRIGLMVGLEETYGAARQVYDRLGYRQVHGPFVTAARLEAEDGSGLGVAGVVVYLAKDL